MRSWTRSRLKEVLGVVPFNTAGEVTRRRLNQCFCLLRSQREAERRQQETSHPVSGAEAAAGGAQRSSEVQHGEIPAD